MKVLSIQVGKPQTVVYRGRPVTTAIFKTPIDGSVLVRKLNLEGDGQADLRLHGGEDKAVYAYSFDGYAPWQRKRPKDALSYGAFGENLTIDHLPENQICIGDEFRLGGAILQAVQPRLPCYKLGVKFNDASVLRLFMELERPGVYFKVLEQGQIEKGEELQLIKRESERVSIHRLFLILGGSPTDEEEIETVLRLRALPAGIREQLSP